MPTKTIRLDPETDDQLKALDRKMNIKPNYSAVIRLAIQKLYEQEIEQNERGIQSRED